MPTSAARRTLGNAADLASVQPLVIYVASSLDGTSFALDADSQHRVRAKFPGVRVSTRRIFISHDTREAFNESIGRFEDEIAVLLTGLQTDALVKKFGSISFRDPPSEREVGRLPEPRRAARRA